MRSRAFKHEMFRILHSSWLHRQIDERTEKKNKQYTAPSWIVLIELAQIGLFPLDALGLAASFYIVYLGFDAHVGV